MQEQTKVLGAAPVGHCYVFVYGTLKKGHRLHSSLLHNDAKYIRDDKIDGFVMVKVEHVWYPAVLLTPVKEEFRKTEMTVYGEIYLITLDALDHLDAVEGIKHGLYERKEVVFPDLGEVFLYVMTPHRANAVGRAIDRICSGIWSEHPITKKYFLYSDTYQLEAARPGTSVVPIRPPEPQVPPEPNAREILGYHAEVAPFTPYAEVVQS